MCARACLEVDCKAAIVTYIDYGSVDSIPLEQLLPLDQVCAIILHGYLSSCCFEAASNSHKAQKSQQYAIEKTAKYA